MNFCVYTTSSPPGQCNISPATSLDDQRPEGTADHEEESLTEEHAESLESEAEGERRYSQEAPGKQQQNNARDGMKRLQGSKLISRRET